MRALILMLLASLSYASCESWVVCNRFKQIWYEGSKELYFSGYAWHNRFTYDKRKVANYNELAWGGGFGKGYFDEKGNWHTLSAIAFLDSHKNLEPAAGYTFLKMKYFSENTKAGLGFAVLLTQRPDIFGGIPFIGVLPWSGFSYRRLTLMATYIPGAAGAGNVLYVLGKWSW